MWTDGLTTYNIVGNLLLYNFALYRWLASLRQFMYITIHRHRGCTDTKGVLSSACIYTEHGKTIFTKSHFNRLLVWLRLINIFLYGLKSKRNLKHLLGKFTFFDLNLKFTHELRGESISFLNLKVNFSESTDPCIKPTYRHQNLHYA